MIRVLFVCLGNICRSPMAEALFQHKVKLAGLEDQIQSDSAGTGDWHVGKPPHHGTAQALAEHGIDYAHQARVFCKEDLDRFDYIITMDEANHEAVEQLGSGPARVASLLSFALHLGIAEVPDPYYTGNFSEVYHLVDEATDGLLGAIRQEHGL
jgi:protein-tyrosine phosphatase